MLQVAGQPLGRPQEASIGHCLQRSWAIVAEHRAVLRALESDSWAALTPTAETLLARQKAHNLLQALNTEAARQGGSEGRCCAGRDRVAI